MRNDKDAEIKSKYDDFSVEELKEALKNIFLFSGEFSDADIKEMDQIMAVLDRKEPITPMYTAEESLKRFKETYADELSSLGVHSTEEVMQEKVPADSETVVSIPETSTVRPVRRRRLFRIGLVAAIMVAIILAAAVTASAFGYNLFGWVPKWNNDVLSFGEDESPEPNDLHVTRKIPAALEQLGIDEPLYPTWLPEGFRIEYSEIEMDPVFLHEGYSDGERYLSITIEPSTMTDILVYQKDDNPLVEYKRNDTTHYIFSDIDQITATWQTANYSVCIVGNVSLDTIEKIVDSVYWGIK